jgi:hypothetical protein
MSALTTNVTTIEKAIPQAEEMALLKAPMAGWM